MKIFVHSASLDEIRRLVKAGVADGVSLPLEDFEDATAVQEHVAMLGSELAIPMCVPVSAFHGPDIYRDARELARASEHVIVQIPFIEDAIVPIRKLVADGVKVCAMYVYSGAQAFFAAKIGAHKVSISVDDLDAQGARGADAVKEIRSVLDRTDLECDLMVTTPRTVNQFTESLLAGANVICATPTVIRALTLSALTDRGVDRFLRDVSRLHKPRPV